MTKQKLLILSFLRAISTTMAAQKVFELPLWPDGTPNRNGLPSDTAKVHVYLPNEQIATGRAIVIFPGGAYSTLNIEHEGNHWAEFFNNLGIAAIVVKYRMPNGNEEVPVSDAEEAMRLIRRNAPKWHIRSDYVGVMGSGTGGHLAAILSTQAQKSAKPDFQILYYPVITMLPEYAHHEAHDNFFGKNSRKKLEQKYSADMHVTRLTPRAFIVLCDDDAVVQPANGLNYYTELYRHDVPASLHIYPDGGHGWGAKVGFKYHLEMIMELKAWLKSF